MLRSLLLIVAIWLLSGCTDSTPLSVENRSGVSLQSVVVSGSGFSQVLGSIEPGATVKSHIRPSGESGIAISFIASGKRVALPADGYFEAGGRYSVTVVVTPRLGASVDSQLQPY